jgi:hypothetical protein
MDLAALDLGLLDLGRDAGRRAGAAQGARMWAALAPPSPPKREKTKTTK